MDLTLILTEDCDLRCTYCYQKQFRPVDMPPEIALAAIGRATWDSRSSFPWARAAPATKASPSRNRRMTSVKTSSNRSTPPSRPAR